MTRQLRDVGGLEVEVESRRPSEEGLLEAIWPFDVARRLNSSLPS